MCELVEGIVTIPHVEPEPVVDRLTQLRKRARIGQHEADLEPSALRQGWDQEGRQRQYCSGPRNALQEASSCHLF